MDFVIIVAGGRGKRMGGDIPKQFLPLKGRPLLMHTILLFFQFDSKLKIILTLPKEHLDYWELICKENQFSIPHKVVVGGETRFESVKNGLSAVDHSDGVVAIHDGVRPMVSNDTIERCFDCARKLGTAVPVITIMDSIRMKDKRSSVPVDRNQYYIVQTPQIFKIEMLLKAYQQNYSADFTDDASVVEKSGVKIELVEGNRENIKITTPLDMIMAETFLNKTYGN
jgi:2-C-methyl-D-erythritol 4-phosphate cytidylyltransferase